MSDPVSGLQIAASILGGGAVGAIITAVVTSYRGRVQPIGRRVEVSPLFTSGFAGSSLTANVTVSDGTTDYKFPNLHVADIQLVNRGNRDLPTFTFGVTLSKSDKAVHVEPYGLDRHYIANLQKPCTPANPTGDLDFELKPFNRGNSYTLKVFIVAGGSELGSITLGSAEAVRFTEIPSLAETIAKAASTYAVHIGPFEIRLPK
jgi:hypothetical protein